jgi:chromosome partitioning protein
MIHTVSQQGGTNVKKICVINQKGGVGKTTTVVNIAAGLARSAKKVLLVDLDPQGNLETCFPLEENKPTMYEIISEGVNANLCIHKVAVNLDIIAASQMLTKAEMSMVNKTGREYILTQKLEKLSGYDYLIIDCSPSFGLLNQNALLFCDEAIIPVSTDVLGIDALRKISKNIEMFNDVHAHSIVISKIIPTMYDAKNKVCKEILRAIQNEFYEKVTHPISTNAKLREAAKSKKSIFAYAPKSSGAKDYKQIVRAILHEEARYAGKPLSINIQEGTFSAKAHN